MRLPPLTLSPGDRDELETRVRSNTVEQTRAGMQLHCIVDNLATHFTPTVEAFLEDRPHIFLHTTPTHASWLKTSRR